MKNFNSHMLLTIILSVILIIVSVPVSAQSKMFMAERKAELHNSIEDQLKDKIPLVENLASSNQKKLVDYKSIVNLFNGVLKKVDSVPINRIYVVVNESLRKSKEYAEFINRQPKGVLIHKKVLSCETSGLIKHDCVVLIVSFYNNAQAVDVNSKDLPKPKIVEYLVLTIKNIELAVKYKI